MALWVLKIRTIFCHTMIKTLLFKMLWGSTFFGCMKTKPHYYSDLFWLLLIHSILKCSSFWVWVTAADFISCINCASCGSKFNNNDRLYENPKNGTSLYRIRLLFEVNNNSAIIYFIFLTAALTIYHTMQQIHVTQFCRLSIMLCSAPTWFNHFGLWKV